MCTMANNQKLIVHFVRHGLVYNPDNVYYGQLENFRLSDVGMQQARAVGQRLVSIKTANEMISTVYSSPLLRTRQTAGQIAAELLTANAQQGCVEVRTEVRLVEVHSAHDGTPISTLQERGWHTIYAKESGGEFETFKDVHARVSGVLQSLATKHLKEDGGGADEHVVCVSHGDLVFCAYMIGRGVPATLATKLEVSEGSYQFADGDSASGGFYPDTASMVTLTVELQQGKANVSGWEYWAGELSSASNSSNADTTSTTT